MRLLPLAFRAAAIGGLSLAAVAQHDASADPNDPAACAAHERVYVLTLWPQDHDSLAAQFGLIAECCEPEIGLYAFRPHTGTTQGELDAIVASAEQNWAVVTATRDRSSRVPEVESCSLTFPDLVGIQDCTVGFVSGGTPQVPCEPNPWQEQIGLDGLGAPKKTTRVAVIDSGVDPTHPALEGRLAGNGFDFVLGIEGGYLSANGIDDDGDGLVDEGVYHGTQVASLICQVDPGARILPYRVCDSEGNGRGYDVARAVMHAVWNGAEVINLSLSFAEEHPAVDLALRIAILAGVEVCVAAGNTGADNVLFPASLVEDPWKSLAIWKYPFGVLSVSSVDATGARASFGAWGSAVDLVAPSVELCAAAPGGTWGPFSGTSAATAVASGALSRLRSSKVFDKQDAMAIELLIGTAQPQVYDGEVWDSQLGAGVLDVEAALAQAKANK